MYFANITNNKINGTSKIDNSRFATETNFQIEISQEIYLELQDKPNKYLYDVDMNSIILNPDYETEEQQKAIAQRVAELKAELDKLDLKSIRAIRSGDTEYIAKYEAEAEELREQIRELENG